MKKMFDNKNQFSVICIAGWLFLAILPHQLDAFHSLATPSRSSCYYYYNNYERSIDNKSFHAQHLPKLYAQYYNRRLSTTKQLMSDLFREVEEETTTTPTEPVPEPVFDNHGREFVVGSVVRVVVEGLRAYQVTKKARGTFDETTKEFRPDESVPYLTLPVGLRGKIIRVYDIEEVTANYPILVQFTPDENTEEGYSAPTASFTMHFRTDEVECVKEEE